MVRLAQSDASEEMGETRAPAECFWKALKEQSTKIDQSAFVLGENKQRLAF